MRKFHILRSIKKKRSRKCSKVTFAVFGRAGYQLPAFPNGRCRVSLTLGDGGHGCGRRARGIRWGCKGCFAPEAFSVRNMTRLVPRIRVPPLRVFFTVWRRARFFFHRRDVNTTFRWSYLQHPFNISSFRPKVKKGVPGNRKKSCINILSANSVYFYSTYVSWIIKIKMITIVVTAMSNIRKFNFKIFY